MGIFGPIDNNKAIEIIRNNFDEIINETNFAMDEIAKTKTSINGISGIQILWNIIQKAEVEIPTYIERSGLSFPTHYPYGDPSIFVACSIMYKYDNANKDDKKYLSNCIEKVKKDGLYEIIQDIVKTYCDNMEKSLMRPKPYDKQKETVIKFLADNFEFYDKIFGQRQNDNNGNSRLRK